MDKNYLGLPFVIIVICFVSFGIAAREDPNCRVQNLEFGQSYYRFKDNAKLNATDALRNSMTVYTGKIHQYVEFFIVVPDVYHGVKVQKLCAFTKNVVNIDLTINKEAIPDVFGEPDHVDRMSENLKASRKWQKSCFWPQGEVASLIMKLNIGPKKRVKVKKLFMKACEGENYAFL